MIFLLIYQSTGNIYVQGENYLDVLGINQSINQSVNQFTHMSDLQYVEHIYLSKYNGYIFQNNNIYITGNAYQLENKNTQQQPIEQSQFLQSQDIQNMMNSEYHAIILYNNSTVYTIGNNEQGQLGRPATTDYSQGEVNITVTNPIQVGALQNLSFIVNSSHIFFVGKCSHCLCGMQNGIEDTSQHDVWQSFNFTALVNKSIQKVHFGNSQLVVQTTDSNLYYLGDASNYQACNGQTQICDFTALPYQYKDMFIITDYATAYVENNNIQYCGCQNIPSCTNKSNQITPLKQQSFNDTILGFYAGNAWVIITTKQVFMYNSNYTSINNIVSLNATHTQPEFPTNIAGSKYATIIYSRPRYLNIQLSDVSNITLNGQFFQLNQTNESVFIPYSLCGPDQKLKIVVSSTQFMPVYDTISLNKNNASVNYTLIPKTDFVINYTFIDVQNNPVDQVQVEIISKFKNQSIYSSALQTSIGNITIQSDLSGLKDTWTIVMTPNNTNLFPQNATKNITNTNISLRVLFQTHFNYTFKFINSTDSQPLSNLNVTITMNTTTNIGVTNSTGFIVVQLEKSIYDQFPSMQFDISFSGTANYHPKDLNITISHNTTQTQQISIDPILTFMINITVPNDTVGYFQAVNINNNRAICASINYTNQTPVFLTFNQSTCNITVGTSLRIEYYDSTRQFFALNYSYQMYLQTNIIITIVNNSFMTDILFNDQYHQPVVNYNVQYSTDNRTFTSQLTSSTGEISFNVNLTELNITNKSLYLKADSDRIYKSLALQQLQIRNFIQQTTIQVSKYVTFNITISVVDSLNNQPVRNIFVKIYSSPNIIILSGTTNSQGKVNFIEPEINMRLAYSNTYTVEVIDRSGTYKQYNTTFYIQSETIEVQCLLNAQRVRFQLFDIVGNRNAVGCQMTIYTDRDVLTKLSDNNGQIQFDVTGTITQDINYSIAGTDIYKPVDNSSVGYDTGYIHVNVSTYLNFTLTLIIQDGIDYKLINNMNVSIYTQLGDLKYNSLSDQQGRIFINCSEKDDIVQLNTVYNLSIVDTMPRYHKQSRNYTVRTTNQETIVYMNLQMLVVTIVNYEAVRIPNVLVYVYSNDNKVGEEITNPLGVSQFYLRQDQYIGKTITYYVNQSEFYKPSNGKIKVEIKNQPQQAIRRVTPLIMFEYNILLMPVVIVQNCTSKTKPNNTEPNKCTSVVDTPGSFLLQFLTKRNETMYKTYLYEINISETFKFIENINQTFKLSTEYVLSITDENKVYEPVSIIFDSNELVKDFKIQLKLQEPKKFIFPFYGYLLILTVLLTAIFLPYVIIKYNKFKKQYRVDHNIVSRLVTVEQKEAEQKYVQNLLADFLNADSKDIQRQHTIVRNQGTSSELEKYFTLTGFQTEILSTGTILTTQQNITDFLMDK